MGRNKCLFSRKWLSNKDYSWVRECNNKEDKYKALCSICNKTFDIGAMGESALKSHMKSEKHKSNQACTSGIKMTTFLAVKTPTNNIEPDDSASSGLKCSDSASECTIVPQQAQVAPSLVQCQISTYVNKDDVLKAEILWTLQSVTAHNSYKSNENVGKVLQAMFPDSAIAAKFTCGEKKTAYMSLFGLAEHFIGLLKEEVSGYFVILFDESLNKKTQQQQMDIHVRYWKDNEVTTRYLGSEFLGKNSTICLLCPRNKRCQIIFIYI